MTMQGECKAAAFVWLALSVVGLPLPAIAQTGSDTSHTLELEVVYKGDAWANVSGGQRRDTTYLDNLDLVASFDGEKGLGLRGTRFVVSALYNNRNTFSDRIVGDTQTISNIDADGALRLYEAWVDYDFGRGALKAGLINLNSEFDVNETGGLFVNSSHGIGPDFSQIGATGPSIFPITGLGARARIEVTPRLQFRLGLFEGVPGSAEHPRRTTIRLDTREGQLLVGEADYRLGESGRFVLGVRQLSGRAGDPQDPDNLPRQAQTGGYALIEGPVARFGGGTLAAFARVGLADPDSHDIAGYLGFGTVFSGPLLAGEAQQEQIGLAVGIARNSARFRREQEFSGNPLDRHETAIELSYRIQATRWLALQPDVQYIINPGSNPALGNALAVGLRFELGWKGGS